LPCGSAIAWSYHGEQGVICLFGFVAMRARKGHITDLDRNQDN